MTRTAWVVFGIVATGVYGCLLFATVVTIYQTVRPAITRWLEHRRQLAQLRRLRREAVERAVDVVVNGRRVV